MNQFYLQVQKIVARRLGIKKINSLGIFEQQVVLLPFWFAQAIDRPIPRQLLIYLATANLYGWIAYDIYDDFMDSQGKPRLIPLANICHRELVTIYKNLFSQAEEFNIIFHKIMDRVDKANSWEQANVKLAINNSRIIIPQKLPVFNIKNLADRSLGHVLGPIAILCKIKYSTGSSEICKIINFFEFYLAARQLSDDAHDWWEDLVSGSLNSSSALVLKNLEYPVLDLGSDEELLRKTFWIKVIPEILDTISQYLDNCLNIIQGLEIIKQPDQFLKMVSVIRKSVNKTRCQQQKIRNIILS